MGFAGAVLRLFIIFNSNWDKDEPQSLRYAITPNCSKGADGGHAVRHSHQNGLSGPRDGISIKHVSEAIPASAGVTEALREEIEAAGKRLQMQIHQMQNRTRDSGPREYERLADAAFRQILASMDHPVSAAVTVKPLVDALNRIRDLNRTGEDENGHRWVNSDLIEQEIVFALAAFSQPAQGGETAAARDVLAERQRQISDEGWSVENDDSYQGLDLAAAAACYAMFTVDGVYGEGDGRTPPNWPWVTNWWKPTTPRRALVKAGALILAEIERLDRAAQAGEG